MDDDDGFASDVDVYVEEAVDVDDTELLRRRSSRSALSAAADNFLRRHSGTGASPARPARPARPSAGASSASPVPSARTPPRLPDFLSATAHPTSPPHPPAPPAQCVPPKHSAADALGDGELGTRPSAHAPARRSSSSSRDAESVRRDKERLQRFALEAASFLDDNSATVLVDDGHDIAAGASADPAARSDDDFRARRRVELDKARLERFAREAEAFIDAAYADDPTPQGGRYVVEEALSPSASPIVRRAPSANANADPPRSPPKRMSGQDVARNKELLTSFHNQAMSFLDASAAGAIPIDVSVAPEGYHHISAASPLASPAMGAVGSSSGSLRSPSLRQSRRVSIQRDKERLEEHYREAMAFLDSAEKGVGIVEERELETGALDRVRLKLYAREAMNFLENAFAPDSDILVDDGLDLSGDEQPSGATYGKQEGNHGASRLGSRPGTGKASKDSSGHVGSAGTGGSAVAGNAAKAWADGDVPPMYSPEEFFSPQSTGAPIGDPPTPTQQVALDAAVKGRFAELAAGVMDSGHGSSARHLANTRCTDESDVVKPHVVTTKSVGDGPSVGVPKGSPAAVRQASADLRHQSPEANTAGLTSASAGLYEGSLAREDERVQSDDEAAQIARDREAMERYYDEDDFGQSAVVEETLSDTSGDSDRGLFARRVGDGDTTSTESAGERDEWGGKDVSTDTDVDMRDDDQPDQNEAAMAARMAAINRSLGTSTGLQAREGMMDSDDDDAVSSERKHAKRELRDQSEALAERRLGGSGRGSRSGSAHADNQSPLRGPASRSSSGGGRGSESGGTPRSRHSPRAAAVPPLLHGSGLADLSSPSRVNRNVAALNGNSSRGMNEASPELGKRTSSVTFADNAVAYSPQRSYARSRDAEERELAASLAAQADEDCLVELLLEGTDAGGGRSEWSEVPLEKSFYRSVPRGATIKLRSRSSRASLALEGEPLAGLRENTPVTQSVSDKIASMQHKAELARVEQERDVIMAALEEVVNERSLMAAQIAEMKQAIVRTFGRSRHGETLTESGDIDVAAELKDAYIQFEQIIRESEATVNVLEGHIAEGQKRIAELEMNSDLLRAVVAELEAKLAGMEEQAASHKSLAVELSSLREEKKELKEEHRGEIYALEGKLKTASSDLSEARSRLKQLEERLQKEKKECARLEEEVSKAQSGSLLNSGTASSGSSSGHLWMQVSAAREDAEEARKGQDRAERRLREVQREHERALALAREAGSGGGGKEGFLDPKTVAEEKRVREEGFSRAIREKNTEIERLREDVTSLLKVKQGAQERSSNGEVLLLKADVEAKARQMEDLQKRVDRLAEERMSLIKSREVALSELDALRRSASETAETTADVSALLSRIRSLEEEVEVRDKQANIQVEEAMDRAQTAEHDLALVRTMMIEEQQAAEKTIEHERRARKAAETRRNALQVELNEAMSKSASLGGSSAGLSTADNSGLAKSPSKRGIGMLRKSSSKSHVGKKKDKDKVGGRTAASQSSSSADDTGAGAPELKRKGRRGLFG